MRRTVVLHYHLFKNAGTSVDQMLQDFLGSAWVTAEFAMGGMNNTDAVTQWIADNPEARAFSSHTLAGPLPKIPDCEIIPVMLLRDPFKRIASAYSFERKQQISNWGADLAKEHDFEGYVRARLDVPQDRQCRNFQTSRLAALMPGTAPELDRACEALTMLHDIGVIGRVERFDAFTKALTDRLADSFTGFAPETVRANTTARKNTSVDLDLAALLAQANTDDIALLDHADRLLGKHA